MTDHPCKGMTKGQIAAFERLAIGEPPNASVKTLEALLSKGVIAKDEDRIVGRDALGTIRVPQFYVPIPLHWQWCEWCSEQDGDAP